MSRETPTQLQEQNPSYFPESKMDVYDQVYDQLVTEYKESAIKPGDFSDLYGQSVIKDDTKYVKKMEKRFTEQEGDQGPSEKIRKRAEILEALLAEQIELGEWFGPDAQTINTSRYDDIVNGVDMAIEFEREEGFKHLALSIDVTSGDKIVAEKLERIRQQIEAGQLTQIKYFLSEKSDIRGELRNMPRVIIGADPKTIRELSELWLTVKNLRRVLQKKEGLSEDSIKSTRERIKEAIQKLAEHKIQQQLLLEIEMQLRCFVKLAIKSNRPEVAQKYQNALDLVASIVTEKEILREELDTTEDAVFQSIRLGVKTLEITNLTGP